MYKKVGLLGLYCESPVHAGSGSDLGIVDLPIQREKSTQYPIFQASTLKGALRESFECERAIKNSLKNGVFDSFNINSSKEGSLKEAINLIFGHEDNQAASAITFTDARTLLFPVKSAKNVFSWVTCPSVLSRLKRDLDIANIEYNWEIPKINKEAVISEKLSLDEYSENKVVLEEYTFDVSKDSQVEKIANWINKNVISPEDNYWQEKLEKDLIILNDEDFEDFVTMSTEVQARTKIDNETKTVAPGALWYEENLPAESVLYSLVMTTDILVKEKAEKAIDLDKAEDIIRFFNEGLQGRIQLGGNETIGKGIIKTNLVEGGETSD